MLHKKYFSIMFISLVLLFTGCCFQIPVPGPHASVMLANLAVSENTLNPAFDFRVSKYSVAVPNSSTSITVTATLEDTKARLWINEKVTVSGQASSPIPLEVGVNHISVIAQAEDGYRRYVTITVTRAEPISWTKQFGSSQTDVAFATAIDDAGNVFVAGWTEGTLVGSSVGSADAFLSKHDTNGNTLWTRQFGSSAFDRAVAVAANSYGVVVAGVTEGNLAGSNSGAADMFVRKFNTAGDVVWTQQFGSSVSETATAVAIDTLGNVLVAGFTEGDLEGSSFGSEDAFVRKYAVDGSVIWTRQFGTAALDRATAIAVNDADQVFIAGGTDGDLDGSNAGATDAFIRQYDVNGIAVWTNQFGATTLDAVNALAVDSSGYVLLAGATDGNLEGSNSGGTDAFLRKYGTSGNIVWTQQFGTSAFDLAHAIAVDKTGDVVVAGWTGGNLQGTNAGHEDAFIRSYAADGTAKETQQFGSIGSDLIRGVAIDISNRVLVVGETDGSLEGSNTGGIDAFVRKIAPETF